MILLDPADFSVRSHAAFFVRSSGILCVNAAAVSENAGTALEPESRPVVFDGHGHLDHDSIGRSFAAGDLHGPGSAFELLIESLDRVGLM